MNTLSRKQREIIEREALILDIASDLLHKLGYLGLNMDRIAEASEYSKGTVYQHFCCKEEVLCALSIRYTHIQVAMFKKATELSGLSREKISAVLIAHQLFVKLYKREFSNMQIIKNSSIKDKISEQSQQALQDNEYSCLHCVSQIVQEAITNTDLKLDDMSPPEFVFGLWSLSFGAAQIQTLDISLSNLGINEPAKLIWKHANQLLDGYNWKPLTSEWDYENTYKRIQEELYQDEINTLNEMGCRND